MILKEIKIQAGEAYPGEVPVEVEVTIADTWAEKQKKQLFVYSTCQ